MSDLDKTNKIISEQSSIVKEAMKFFKLGTTKCVFCKKLIVDPQKMAVKKGDGADKDIFVYAHNKCATSAMIKGLLNAVTSNGNDQHAIAMVRKALSHLKPTEDE